ncbi:MAG: hydantoinase/oxoprolinase family protein [Zavarzinia sp.]|nr:hydantoinase/oxoprolinase family protein [Zavarzinia sp.]
MTTSGVFLGVDTGGTFTDIVGLDAAGRIIVRKADNREANAAASIADGIRALLDEQGIAPSSVSRLVHCTTILGNSVFERKGPVCGLITTAGFRDVLELGRQHNPVLYDIFWKKTPPLVPRRRIVEVEERMASDGSVVRPIDPDSLDAAIDALAAQGVEAVAVCLINACTNATHEQTIAERLRERLPGATISLSSEISPEWGEYERTSTTVTDAFLKPTFARYLSSLEDRLQTRDLVPELLVMQSAGSITDVEEAKAMPVRCLDSGPAAGVIAAANIGAALGFPDVLTLEIGGTTAKSALIEGGEPRRSMETEIGTPTGSDGRALRGGGFVLRMPVIDAAEVGAGGGSIASVDAGGSLSVGPQGAGAFPGPASYGRGGARPTVTDANLVLGYLSETQALGGTIRLDRSLAEAAIRRHVAEPLGIDVLDAAHAIRSLANAIMGRAVRTVSTERGRDVRKFALLAAGGGGPGHAAEIARVLGVDTVIIPPFAGLFASLGLLLSPSERRASRAVNLRLRQSGVAAELAALLDALALDATGKAAFEGTPTITEEVDVRYAGQFHQITVPLPRRDGAVDTAAIREAFEMEHERTYGYRSPREHCEIAAVRVVARYPRVVTSPNFQRSEGGKTAHPPRRIYFGPRLGPQSARVLSREDLGEKPVQGPIVIPEYDTTVIVPPDFTVRRNAANVLILERVKTEP